MEFRERALILACRSRRSSMHWWWPPPDASWSGVMEFQERALISAFRSRRSSMHWWWPYFDARWRGVSLMSPLRVWMSACWSRRDWTFKIDPSHTAAMRASLSCDDDGTCCGCVDGDERSSSTSSSSLHMIDVRWWLRDSINQAINQVTSLIVVVRWLVGWYTTPTQSHDSSTETRYFSLSLSLSLCLSISVELLLLWERVSECWGWWCWCLTMSLLLLLCWKNNVRLMMMRSTCNSCKHNQ